MIDIRIKIKQVNFRHIIAILLIAFLLITERLDLLVAIIALMK